MIKKWMKIIVICCCCYQTSVNAETVDVELKYYSKASYYLGQGNFRLASKQWHQLSLVFLRSEAKLGNRKMWQYAGLAEALAAIAADKANDVIAYQYWADSTRYLMTGGTNWSRIQKQLHRRFETTNTQLSAFMQVNDLSVNESDRWQQDLTLLQTWSDKLAVFSFTAPQLGLSGKPASIEIAPQQPAVNYQGAFQPNKKLTGLASSSFRGNQITPVEVKSLAVESVTLTKKEIQEVTEVENIKLEAVDSKEIQVHITPTISNSVNGFTPRVLVPQPLSQNNAVDNNESKIKPAGGSSVGLTPIRITGSGLSQQVTSGAEVKSFDATPLVDVKEIDPKPEVSIISNSPKIEPETSVADSQPNPLARGNMATIEDENVEALQRRSFAPISEN